jgi:polyvinyl alcohol dehydrogenase (cytochrome)
MRLRAALVGVVGIATFTVGGPIGYAETSSSQPGGGMATGSLHATTRTGLRTPVTPNGSWPVYHRDDAHTGSDPSPSSVSSVQAGWVSPVLDQQVYASPVIYGGLVYTVTLNNTVYALNQTDGTVQWSLNLGAPETGGWTCGGNVSPQGILGTPVVDPGSGRIYVAWLDANDVYWVDGIGLLDGTSHMHTAVTTPAPGFDWRIQQERGALGIANGYVYVPFGGRVGDCGNYHGYVFAVPTNGTAVSHYYQTPGLGSGFWAAGGVVIDDSTGKVFATSGNAVGSGCDAILDGTPKFENDAVVRLSATLAHEDSFIPEDWHDNWCVNDQDLGAASPVLISPSLMFQAGKWGTGFLLNPAALGGVDGQLFPTPQPAPYVEAPVCFGNHSDASFGSYAYKAPYVYLECDGNGIVALNVNTSVPSFTPCDLGNCPPPNWNAGPGITFGPPIVAVGAVWAISIGGGGIYAFRAGTGALIYHSAGFGTNHFVTPAEAGGQVFAPAGLRIRQFLMHFGANQSQIPPAPPSHGVPVVQNGAPPPPSRPVNQSTPTPPPPR